MNETTIEIPQRKPRHFIDEAFTVTDWETLKPYFDRLLKQEPNSAEALKKWIKDRSELEAIISEDAGWRYIKMTCDTTDQNLLEAYKYFISQINPKISPYSDKLNRKVMDNAHLNEVRNQSGFENLVKLIEKDIRIFREKNIPLQTRIQEEAQKFGAISGSLGVTLDGEELTLQQAAVHLQSTDRNHREHVYHEIQQARMGVRDKLNNLYSSLIDLRDQVARNAGFPNFRDYMFTAMGRFDYSPDDCFAFHKSVESEVVPLLSHLANERKELLGVDHLRPWDKSVDKKGRDPLKPFQSVDELVDKTITCFHRVDPYFGECLSIMQKMGHLDLDSRKGKAPGGYNYPLAEIGVPFIFMNATSTLRDLVTLMHEGGHAVHSFLMRDLELDDFKHPPSEVAELASMSMELLTMDQWHLFFEDEDELKRAKQEHLEQIIQTLPWVATIDAFQHWIYTHPNHSSEDRKAAWLETFGRFDDNVTEWEGLERYKQYAWQKQLHLYEVPFYYIEYGMAQLGAVSVWKNYRENASHALEQFKAALQLGYTQSIPQIYEAAGIRFDFSKDYIRELMTFVRDEMDKI